MKIYQVTEARRNSSLNPKISIYDALKQRVADSPNEADNLYVSFTAVDKLGINPQSIYNTPIGIYAYPATYVLQRGSYSMTALPFAGNQPYGNIFSIRDDANIIFLDEVTDWQIDEVSDILEIIFSKVSNKLKNELRDILDMSDYHARVKWNDDSNGHRLWAIFYHAAGLYAKSVRGSVDKRNIVWNWLNRQCGIDGYVDNGNGIIHESEPTQAVFFDSNVIIDVERIKNKYDKASRITGQNKSATVSSRNLHIKEIVEKYKNDGDINDLVSSVFKMANGDHVGITKQQLAYVVKNLNNESDIYKLIDYAYTDDFVRYADVLFPTEYKKYLETQATEEYFIEIANKMVDSYRISEKHALKGRVTKPFYSKIFVNELVNRVVSGELPATELSRMATNINLLDDIYKTVPDETARIFIKILLNEYSRIINVEHSLKPRLLRWMLDRNILHPTFRMDIGDTNDRTILSARINFLLTGLIGTERFTPGKMANIFVQYFTTDASEIIRHLSDDTQKQEFFKSLVRYSQNVTSLDMPFVLNKGRVMRLPLDQYFKEALPPAVYNDVLSRVKSAIAGVVKKIDIDSMQ